jgi:hypothetical protein
LRKQHTTQQTKREQRPKLVHRKPSPFSLVQHPEDENQYYQRLGSV